MSVFAVSKVRLDSQGCVSDVLWGVVDTKSNHWVSLEHAAPVKAVLDAIHNGDQVVALFPTVDGHVPGGQFVAVGHDNGHETIALAGAPTFERELPDMDRLGR